ncbi:hypothetical protein NDU88_008644 [Pleurodeles waltl]|uniref:Uncharacterized protein n=1 Tax=Pleurodeles waltl TaxID=8319 RepID=A0AAV7N5J1_PLEWA|nr:hypothetical protein NDU88_008644 [Pleurodeles waltl]
MPCSMPPTPCPGLLMPPPVRSDAMLDASHPLPRASDASTGAQASDASTGAATSGRGALDAPAQAPPIRRARGELRGRKRPGPRGRRRAPLPGSGSPGRASRTSPVTPRRRAHAAVPRHDHVTLPQRARDRRLADVISSKRPSRRPLAGT